ncbi:MAG TPA: hypothetical protein VF117_06020 [Gammaproteobacteria bacterium]
MNNAWEYEDLNSALILAAHGWARKINLSSAETGEKLENEEWWRCVAKLLNPNRYHFLDDSGDMETSKAIFDLRLFKRSLYLDQYKEKISQFERDSGAFGRLGPHIETNLFSGFLVIADETYEMVIGAVKSRVQSIQFHLSVGRMETHFINSVWNTSASAQLIARVDQIVFMYGQSVYDLENQT